MVSRHQALPRGVSAGLSILGLVVLIGVPRAMRAQANALFGLLTNAEYLNFYLQKVTTRGGNMRAASGSATNGVGFEFAYGIPGAITIAHPSGARPCTVLVNRVRVPCMDTVWTTTERTIGPRGRRTVKQVVTEIRRHAPRTLDTLATLDLGIGFSQAGAFEARDPADTLRVSLRELPYVTVYADIGPNWLVSPYLGVRSGLATLQGGRLYRGDTLTKFGGDTFQLGGVVGLITEMWGISAFVEYAYERRAFPSVEWDGTPPPRYHALAFNGPSLAAGLQFNFPAKK